MAEQKKPYPKWKYKLHEILYGANTPAGKFFDIALLIAILVSIMVVMLESVTSIDQQYHKILNITEWVITILFTVEYIARIISIKKPRVYIFSFFGIVDLLSTIPKYLSLFLAGSHALVALRALRLLRIFRILKLVRYLGASDKLSKALIASKARIFVFLFAVVILCSILGTVMYLVEGNSDSGFTSIPRSIYWAIVTLTTVGYGDIHPITPLGQLIASMIMILGYGIIAIPTGIVSAEYVKGITVETVNTNTRACTACNATNHIDDAKYCSECGNELNSYDEA